MTRIQCGQQVLDLSHPRVMGVLNITPDSFSDGGVLFRDGKPNLDAVCQLTQAMVTNGAAVLDIGGESTRPGALPVSEQEEIDRVVPVVEAITARFETIISLDTSTPAVMQAGTAAGAGLINDVRALRRPGAVEAAAQTGLPIVLMHMQGEPDTMQANPHYGSVVDEVCGFLESRAATCAAAGISRERLLYDPGFGFGKTPEHNFALLKGLPTVCRLGQPVLAGLSRKSMITSVLDRTVDQRLSASLSLAVLAAVGGARLLRVHDVAETFDALAMVGAWREASQ